jgi:FixJ family two-component response regulator
LNEPLPIHVVDDEPHVSRALARLLAAFGHPARTYDSAEAFLEAIGATPTGIAIVDYEMPGMNGLELHHRLAAEGRRWQVIFYSARTELQSLQAESNGAWDFLAKPAPGLKILACVNGAIARLERESRQLASLEERIVTLDEEERRALPLLAAGEKGSAIAWALGCDAAHARALRLSVMRKLGVRSAAELRRLLERAAL